MANIMPEVAQHFAVVFVTERIGFTRTKNHPDGHIYLLNQMDMLSSKQTVHEGENTSFVTYVPTYIRIDRILYMDILQDTMYISTVLKYILIDNINHYYNLSNTQYLYYIA